MYTFSNFCDDFPKWVILMFIKNYSDFQPHGGPHVELYEGSNLREFVSKAFYWPGTPEGYSFWEGVALGRIPQMPVKAEYPKEREAEKPKLGVLPEDAAERKRIPIYSGVIAYFPLAIAELAKVSLEGNEQHNPGSPLHWDRSKSGDEKDALLRHIIDGDWEKVAWRAMANLEKELENGYKRKEA